MQELLQNYGPYREFVQYGCMEFDIRELNISNYELHFNSVVNIMRDYIETDFIRSNFITIRFNETDTVDLTVVDYFFNLTMWYIIVAVGDTVKPQHIFFFKDIRGNCFSSYINRFLLDPYRSTIDCVKLNNIIADCLYRFNIIDEFSYYLSNTINLEDFIDLMNEEPEFYDLLHTNLNDVPMDKVKEVGMEKMNKMVDYIVNSEDHCLKDFFRAREGINKKQFKEVAVNIGTKPDGRGGVYPTIVNKNFMNGGVNDAVSFAIESSNGRTSQIIVLSNVGLSGYLARKLGLNNTDTYLHHDPHYVCDSKNFQELYIKNDAILERLEGRYYRFTKNGMEYKVDSNDKSLIGKTILLRSPMTCASAARGEGVCYRCYGDLAYINKDINIGKMAAELLSSVLTQMMLSAKHLLEASVKSLNWKDERFLDFFEIEFNIIKPRTDIDLTGYKLIIDPSDVELDNEDEDMTDGDFVEFNEFVNKFYIMTNEGQEIEMTTNDLDNMFITIDLNNAIRHEGEKFDNRVVLDLDKLQESETELFTVKILNNDLSKLLEIVKKLIDNATVIREHTRHTLLQTLLERLIEGGMGLSSVHVEIILSNQLRNVNDILDKPEWEYENEEYNILSLAQALNRHPSITTSLSYEKIDKLLYNPLTYRKHAPSYFDLFFMEKPQEFLSNKDILERKPEVDERGLKKPFVKSNK